jgi:hypothetical protein
MKPSLRRRYVCKMQIAIGGKQKWIACFWVGRLAACFVQLDGPTAAAVLRGCSDASLCCKVHNASQTYSTDEARFGTGDVPLCVWFNKMNEFENTLKSLWESSACTFVMFRSAVYHRSIQQEEDCLLQHIGLQFNEETGKVLYFGE